MTTDDPGELDPADTGSSELVGPGRYPLRIQPAAALMPGVADCKRLILAWFIRKSFYWMLFLGYTLVALIVYSRDPEHALDFELTTEDTDRLLLAAWLPAILAFAIRFLNGWVALALAMPLALAHEPNLSPRTNFGSGIGKFFDRLHIGKAFRSLRWTHHVRQVALVRLGPTGKRLGKLDPILDIVNITSGVVLFVVLFYIAWKTSP